MHETAYGRPESPLIAQISLEKSEVTIGQGEHDDVTVCTEARFTNRGPAHITSLHSTNVDLLDTDARVIRSTANGALISLAPHGSSTFKLSCSLTPKEFESVKSLRVRYIDASCGLCRSRTEHDENAIERGKRAREHDREMDERTDKLAAWKERFPEGDYSQTLLLGDSIMDMSRRQLERDLPGVTVNADSGRMLEYGGVLRENQEPDNGILDYVRRDSGDYERYVIGTGNNDGNGVTLENAEEIIECLGPGKEIYFVTEMMTTNVYGMDTTNATIDAVVAAYPNVHKIDWHGFVEGNESVYLADACHPKKSAIPDYVGVIKEALDIPHVY